MQKSLSNVVSVVFLLLLSYSCNSPVKVFDKKTLSEEELDACNLFKNLKGEVRYDEFVKISHLLPYCEAKIDSTGQNLTFQMEKVDLKMTQAQLYDLIGEPDTEDNSYLLGKQGEKCAASFILNQNNEVIAFVYLNCKD